MRFASLSSGTVSIELTSSVRSFYFNVRTFRSPLAVDDSLTLRFSQFFANSPDPHQSHHLAWSLELIPSWTFLATQRYVSPSVSPAEPDPLARRDQATELTERELDWIERGLDLAQRYHPVAERRLNELRMYREANQKRLGPQAVVAAPAVQVGEKGRSFRAAMAVAVKQAVPAWA